MDAVKKLQQLLSENEFLQSQLEDLNNVVRIKEDEISLLGDLMDSTAKLQSCIDMNLLEIDQLKYEIELAAQKTTGVEMMNEDLEINWFREIKSRQTDQKEIKSLLSVKANLEIVEGELEESIPLYKMLQDLNEALTQEKSISSLLETENTELKAEIEELTELIKLLKVKKLG